MGFRGIGSALGRQPALNAVKDQELVRSLLNDIPERVGGAEGSLQSPIFHGRVSPDLQSAIDRFQGFNVLPNHQDGRIDPNGETIRTLNRMASRAWPAEYTVPFVPLIGQKEVGLEEAVAENACWWACIRMVLATARVVKPPPQELIKATKALNNMEILSILPRYGMYPAYAYKNDWTGATLYKALKESGPVCAFGRFAAADRGTADTGLEHAIVVVGIHRDNMVRFNDPWEPRSGLMLISDFNLKLHRGYVAIIAAWDNTISRMRPPAI